MVNLRIQRAGIGKYYQSAFIKYGCSKIKYSKVSDKFYNNIENYYKTLKIE